MLAAVASWLAGQGLGVVLGYLGGWLMDYINAQRAAQAQHDAGVAEAEAEQAKEGGRVSDALADEASKNPDEDDILDRLKEGKG